MSHDATGTDGDGDDDDDDDDGTVSESHCVFYL